MKKEEIETFCPTSRKEWRQWLKENHRSKQSVWLVQYKVKSGMPALAWSDAVEEALCFGWIDSVRRSLDDEKYMQLFGKRKAKSVWSKINKEKVQRLIEEGLMTEAGFESIEIAKENNFWEILDLVEELKIPRDLEKEFKTMKGSKKFFLSFSKSTRKAILQWLVLAKREETRQRRIVEIVELASQNLKPKQFR